MKASTSAAGALGRASYVLLGLHIVLIVFSTIALVTFLAEPAPPAWLQTEPNATAYRLGWKYSGPGYVVLGFLAALTHAAWKLGGSRALAMFATASAIALASELLGTSTGYPFGGYSYTALLGYRVMDLVPFPIPLSWTLILYCALAMCGRLLPARDDGRTRLVWALVAGLVLTAWDVPMDPAMVKTFHWVWHEPGGFYGMPYTNWIGWLVTGTAIAWIMLRFAPPNAIARSVSPALFPLALYAANGVMPIAICFRRDMEWAGVLGIVAMGIPLVLAWRAGAHGAAHPIPSSHASGYVS